MNWFQKLVAVFNSFLENWDRNVPSEQQPMNTPDTPPEAPIAPVEPPKYLWDTTEHARHSVRLICDEEGLSVKEKNDLSATIHCESNYNPKCIHKNLVNGKVQTTDFGICQVNDYWHIGPGKDFPSVDYVLNNPDACVRWMCKQWRMGRGKLWVCYLKNMYKNYSA